MSDVGGGKTVEVAIEYSTLSIPSSMLKFVSLLHKCTVMFGISTSSLTNSVFETPEWFDESLLRDVGLWLITRINVCIRIIYVYSDTMNTCLLEGYPFMVRQHKNP